VLVVIEPIGAAMTPFVPFATAIACANVQVLLPGATVLSSVTVIVPACAEHTKTPRIAEAKRIVRGMGFPFFGEQPPRQGTTPPLPLEERVAGRGTIGAIYAPLRRQRPKRMPQNLYSTLAHNLVSSVLNPSAR
jgi:hypothetical protein